MAGATSAPAGTVQTSSRPSHVTDVSCGVYMNRFSFIALPKEDYFHAAQGRQTRVVVSERGVRNVTPARVDAFALCSSRSFFARIEGPFSPSDEAPRGGVRADKLISLGEVRRVEKSINPADTLACHTVSVHTRSMSGRQRMQACG